MRFRIVNRFRFISFVVVVSLAASVLFAGVFNSVLASDVENLKEEQGGFAEITVCEGDTLWAIASEYGAGNKDVRELIYNIRKLNNIKGSEIYPGQIIVVPLD